MAITADLAHPPNTGAATYAPPRRAARLITPGSPQGVLLCAVREALDPSWTPDDAADRLLDQVRSVLVLRLARTRLHEAGRHRITLVHARALATLNIAISRLADHKSKIGA